MFALDEFSVFCPPLCHVFEFQFSIRIYDDPWIHTYSSHTKQLRPFASTVAIILQYFITWMWAQKVQCNSASIHISMNINQSKNFRFFSTCTKRSPVVTINQNNVECWNVYYVCRTIDAINVILKMGVNLQCHCWTWFQSDW